MNDILTSNSCFIFLAFPCHTCWLKGRGGHHTITTHPKLYKLRRGQCLILFDSLDRVLSKKYPVMLSIWGKILELWAFWGNNLISWKVPNFMDKPIYVTNVLDRNDKMLIIHHLAYQMERTGRVYMKQFVNDSR